MAQANRSPVIIELGNDTLRLSKPRDFYVEGVYDLRPDTTLVGRVQTTVLNLWRPLAFPAPVSQYLKTWLDTVLPARAGQKPIIIQILKLICTEVTFYNRGEIADCELKFRVLSRGPNGLHSHGEFAIRKRASATLDVTRFHNDNIRAAFNSSLKLLAGSEWTSVPYKAGLSGETTEDFPWGWPRATDPDSLPEGLYDNIAAFRNGRPIANMRYTATDFQTKEEQYLMVRSEGTDGSTYPTMRGLVFVREGLVFIRDGEKFFRMTRDRNGFYLLGWGMEWPNEAYLKPIHPKGVFAGAQEPMPRARPQRVFTPNAHTTQVMAKKKGYSFRAKYFLDLRTGQLVDETEWPRHQSVEESAPPATLKIYSNQKNLPETAIVVVCGGDTLRQSLKGRKSIFLTLPHPYEAACLMVPNSGPLNLVAMPGVQYVALKKAGQVYIFQKTDEDESEE